jgi:hypothetical protein
VDIDLQLALSAPATDLGNAERLATRFAGRLLWRPHRGWFYLNGTIWSKDQSRQAILRAAHSCVQAITREADALDAAGKDVDLLEDGHTNRRSETLRNWSLRSANYQRIEAMIAAARPYLSEE